MTYLSQFLEAKLKPGAPLKERVDPSKVLQCRCSVKANGLLLSECFYQKTGILECYPGEVRVGGTGLAGGRVGEALDLTVDTCDAGAGDLSINISSPPEVEGSPGVEGTCLFDDDDGVANLSISIREVGEYKMAVRYGDSEVKGSPYLIRIWDPSLVVAYGSGITGVGTSVGLRADVFVKLTWSGMGMISVSVKDPSGVTGAVDVVLTEEPNVLSGFYIPRMSGTYHVSVRLGNCEVAKSPFSASICDLSKVLLGGPGLVKAFVDTNNTIDVFTKHGIRGELAAQFAGPLGPYHVDCHSVVVGDGHWQLCYTPHQVGMLQVSITCGGVAIHPSNVKVPCLDVSQVVVEGPGLKPWIVTGVLAKFSVDASNAGPGDIKVQITNPSGKPVPADTIAMEEGTYSVTFQPMFVGEHTIAVTFAGLNVGSSPYRVLVCNPEAIKLSGLGLKMAIKGVENVVDVCTDGAGLGQVDVEFGGGALGRAAVSHRIVDLEEGYKQVYYTPQDVGMLDITLHYICEGEVVASQWFAVACVDPSMVAVDWDGIGTVVPIGRERQFVVDISKSGAQSVDVSLTDLNGEAASGPTKVVESAQGLYTITFTIAHSGRYQVMMKCGDVIVPGCPHSLTAFDPKAIKVHGLGLEQAIVGVDNIIQVDVVGEEAGGGGEVGVVFGGPSHILEPVNYRITAVSENHYKIVYVPLDVGMYYITVTYAGFPINPKQVAVPCINPSNVTVNGRGLQTGVLVGSPVDFTVDTSSAGPGTVDVALTTAKGEKVEVEVEQTDQGIYNITYIPPCSGDYRAGIRFGGLEVEGSPFVTQACNPKAVVVFGAGIEKAIAMSTNMLTVDASRAGDGKIHLAIEGPEECNVDCQDNGDQTYCISYVPPLVGTYSVNIRFAEVHIPGSPFLVTCSRAPPSPSKCHAHLDWKNQTIAVDARGAGGTGALEVGVWGAQVPARFVSVEHNGDYTFSVSYDIPEPGEAEICIKWHGQHISGSPFKVVTE